MPSAETNILNRLASAPTFHPVTADLFVDDWGLDAGDVVSVKSGDTTYSVPIYNMELDWHGSARAQIQSTGNRERKPLSALKRKEFRTGRGGYGTKKTIEEQGVEYERHFTATDKRITSTMQATGVQVDENGNPVMVYNPETGEWEYAFDTSGQGATLASRVQQTAGALETEVTLRQNGDVTLQSNITQTAGQIRTEVTNNVTNLQSQITQNAESIETEVEARQSGETQLRSTITQTATTIELYVDNQVDALDSRITVNSEAISTEVADRQSADQTLQSNINQTATAISLEVTNRQNDVESLSGRITTEAGKISQIVSAVGSDGQVTAASIVTAINGGASSVVISADHIDLNGVVTATQLDSRLVNADSLFTQSGYAGTISANGMSSATGTISDLTVGTLRMTTSGTVSDTIARKGVKIAGGNALPNIQLLGTGSDAALNIPNSVTHFGNATSSSGSISIPYYTLSSGGGTPAGNITFNIADTAYFQDHVGIASTGSWAWDSDLEEYTRVITANDDTEAVVSLPTISVYSSIPSTPRSSFYASARVGADNRDISAAKSYYLQASGNYVYVTTNGSTPAPGTNVVAQLLNPSSGTGGIASLTAGGWTYTNNTYVNVVTALANDGTDDTTTVTLPTISCKVNTGTSNNATIRPYGPGDHILSAGTSLTVYLKFDPNDNEHVFLTNANATPTSSNTIARADNPAYANGKNAVTLSSASWATTDTSDHNTVSVSTVGRPTALTTSEDVYLTASGWSNGSNTVYLREDSASGTARAHLAVAIPDPANYSSAKISDKVYSVSYTVGGKSFTYSSIDTSGSYNAGWAAAYGKVTLPSAMSVSSNNLVTVKTPPSTVDGTATTTNLYLVCADDYVYIRSADNTTSGTTYARITNTKQGSQGGVASVAIFNSSDAVADWNSWRTGFNSYQSLSVPYAYIRATANDGTIYKYGINAEGVYTAGYNAAPVGMKEVVANAATDDSSVWNSWSNHYTFTLSTKYFRIRSTANDNSSRYSGIDASGIYTKGYNAAPVGLASGTGLVNYVASSNDSSVYDGWAYQDTISMGGYKYRQYEVVAADGSKAYIKIHAENTYNAGANSVTISSATRTAQSNDSSTISGTNSSIGSAGYQYFVITATASNGNTRTIGVNAKPTYDAGYTVTESQITLGSITTSASAPSGTYLATLSTTLNQVENGYYVRFAVSAHGTTKYYYLHVSRPRP